MSLYKMIGELSVTVDGEQEDLYTLCTRDNSNGDPCLIISVLENWLYSADVLASEAGDASVLATLNEKNSADDLANTLGNIQTDDEGLIISASAAKITFFLEDNKEVVDGDYVDPSAEAWEGELLDFLLHPSRSQDFPNLKVFPLAQRSFSDEFGEAIQSDISLLVFSYVILLVYVGCNLGRMDKSCVQMRAALSLSVLVTVGMSIVASTGLAASMGIMYTPLHSLLPFILLGIGVDDSFVIADAFDTVRSASSVRSKISIALSHAGVSITITSLTDLVAFAVSSVTSLPALSSFCLYAALGVTFLFLFQISFFSAALTLDGLRQRNRRRDVCCCLVAPEEVKEGPSSPEGEKEGVGVEMSRKHVVPLAAGKVEGRDGGGDVDVEGGKAGGRQSGESTSSPESHPHTGGLHFFLEHKYAVFLMQPAVKVTVVIAFIALIAFSIVGALRLSVESSERSFIPDNSYVLDTFDRNDKYFGERGIQVDIVTHDFDHFERQDVLADIQRRLDGYEKKSPYVEGL